MNTRILSSPALYAQNIGRILRTSLRESGPFAIECFNLSVFDMVTDRYLTAQCRTVYADSDKISHCVRIWLWED